MTQQMENYITPREWAIHNDLTPARGSQLFTERRFTDACILPDGTRIVNRDTELTPPGETEAPAAIPFPEGGIDALTWGKKNGLTPDMVRAVLAVEPERLLYRFGTTLIVTDTEPPHPLPRATTAAALNDAQLARLADLPESWAKTIIMRREGKTFQEISDELGVSRQRCKQIEAKALHALRTIR